MSMMIGTDGMSPHIKSGLASSPNSVELRPIPDHGPGRSLAAGVSDWTVRARCVIALALALPIMLLARLAVLATSAGPAITRSPSIGADGRIVFLRRFRTTYRDGDGQDAPTGSSNITPVGRFLRLSRIARLPALVDVLMTRIGVLSPTRR